MNAAPEIAFSSEQGKANYAVARRQYPAQAIVDLKTMRDNMAHLVSVVGGPASGTAVMGVVKADAYGHGLLPAALAALAGGATWLGTAQSHEALLLRKLGIGPTLPYFDLGIQRHRSPVRRADRRRHRRIGRSLPGIDAVAAAARKLGKPARVHVKVDSGFGRNGFTPAGFDAALAQTRAARQRGRVAYCGSVEPSRRGRFARCVRIRVLHRPPDRNIQGLHAPHGTGRHSAGDPSPGQHSGHFGPPGDSLRTTRPGIGLYGYEPDPAMGTPRDWHLTPAMRLQAQLGTVKDVEAGHGISYGRTYLTPDNTSTAIVPLGYADGIHRSASGFDMEGAKHVEKPGGPVRIMTTEGPKIYRVCGRVCMDQFIVDLHGSAAELGVHEGDTVELFGPGRGEDYVEPTADDWARAADTISYEIFTCLRNRIPRLYEHAAEVLPAADLAKLDPATLL